MNNKATTIKADIDAFEKSMKRVGYVIEGVHRQMKKLKRQTRILGKQIVRDAIKETRRQPLIHNGKAKR